MGDVDGMDYGIRKNLGRAIRLRQGVLGGHCMKPSSRLGWIVFASRKSEAGYAMARTYDLTRYHTARFYNTYLVYTLSVSLLLGVCARVAFDPRT